MNLATVIARYILGIMFTVFGLNGFLHFIPQPPPASPLALEYLTVLTVSHYFVLIFLIQLIGGLMLLANRFVPLELTLLAPILVNILLFHSLMDIANIGPGVLATILWLVIFASVRPAFRGILQVK